MLSGASNNKAPILGSLFLTTTLSDPFSSAFENDVNLSYWKMSSKNQADHGPTIQTTEECRLRNASKHYRDAANSTIYRPPHYARVVIVGGGMAGLHTALCLAERMHNPKSQDANPPPLKHGEKSWNIFATKKHQMRQENTAGTDKIIILEANEIGNGASGRAKALERLRNIVKKYEIDCGWVESGAVEASIHEMDVMEDEDEEDDGYRILTRQQVDQIMGRNLEANSQNNLYKWGEYDANCAGVDPFALTLGLANAVEQWGVKIYENTKVTTFAKQSITPFSNQQLGTNEGRYTVTTNDGCKIHCDHVVLCTGAESGLSKRLSNSFVPIYTWMAATEPLYDNCPLKKETADCILCALESEEKLKKNKRPTTGSPMCGDDHFALNYWRNDNKKSGRLLFGSLCDTYALPSSLIAWRLRNALSEVYPHLSNVKFDYVWGGKLSVTMNAMPLIGRDIDYDNDDDSAGTTDGGVWFNTGFSGHGIVPTATAGSIIANGILGIPDRCYPEQNELTKTDLETDHHTQLWQLFHTHFPSSSWNGYPFSRLGAGVIFLLYNTFDWLSKKGIPVPRLPEIW
eukprot:scaffold11244_cov75-Cyclotella_meneghiniana.AAC.5